jgi:hypothetical protein
MSTRIAIDRRFCGPPDSANGGYTAGALAAFVRGPAEVTLRAPPPLGAPLEVDIQADAVALRQGSQLIAEARSTELELELPAAIDFDRAVRASALYPGFHRHPYPSCFVCGPQRAEGDGLRLFPGAVEGTAVAAAPWLPGADLCDADGNVEELFVWAALDCPSWWGHAAFAAQTAPILLGRLSARVLSRPRRDERCVVQGWGLSREGRRILCASAVFGEHGDLHAFARATWIEIKA